MIDVRIYMDERGNAPFTVWYDALKDKTTALRIRKRLRQMALGNFGDHKAVGGGVFELRLFFGKRYRVYYAQEGECIVILLTGGDKGSQQNDIAKAKRYWQDYKERL